MREEVFTAGEPGKETLVDLVAKVINHRDDGFRATDLDDPMVKALVLFAHGADRTAGVLVDRSSGRRPRSGAGPDRRAAGHELLDRNSVECEPVR